MRVLVTGGAGFIGSHVVDAFLQAGHTVAVVDNLSTGKEANLNPNARFYHADIRDKDALARVFVEFMPEVISHQAALASVRDSFDTPALYADVNLLGSIEIMELCKRHGIQKLIYASTGGAVYGEPVSLPVTEDHPVNPLDPYGASKHAFEHYLFLYRATYGIPYVILRYPNVYGPRQDPFGEAGVVAIFTQRMLKGEPCIIHGDGLQERDFVYVGDVARANLLAADHGNGEIVNIGSAQGTNINTIFRKLCQLTGADTPEKHGPAKIGEVRFTRLDASRARKILGWQPRVGLDDGLASTVAFFREAR